VDKLRITGGRPLEGEIAISGAKNAALPILCAALLTEQPLALSNVPRLKDIATMAKLLGQMGVEVERLLQNQLSLRAKSISEPTAPYELVKTMRASVLVLGPLLARCGRAKVSLPGGCAIGQRPVDQHVKGLQAMGASISIEHGYMHAAAERLRGARIVMDLVTVTGTENLMMAAVLAKGKTQLFNAAREPEIVDLCNLLVAMGAKIRGIGSSHLIIDGVEALHGTEYEVMPDRIEAGSYACAAGITGGSLDLIGARPDDMRATLNALAQAGLMLEFHNRGIKVSADGGLKPLALSTAPFPGFATDMQAQFMAMLCRAEGDSFLEETIFENRYMHVPELRRMGADVDIHGRSAIVRGVQQLTGANVMATDLRASMSLVLAGLAAEGETEVLRVYHLDRGYERLEEKLSAVGATIERRSAG
jgi:UDP-N-acetylglucosamine 1-carboxyvinyltransferase